MSKIYIMENERLSVSAELAFIERSTDEELINYIYHTPLCNSNVPRFFQVASKNTIKLFLRLNVLSGKNEEVLLDTQDVELLSLYFERYIMRDEIIAKMFEIGNPEIISAYIRYHKLPEAHEAKLFSAGYEKEAAYYVMHYPLYVVSEVPMMIFGGVNMVRNYITRQDLHAEAEKLLLTPRFDCLVNEYRRLWCFSREVKPLYDEWFSTFTNCEEE